MLRESDRKGGDLNKPPLDKIQPVSNVRDESLKLLTRKLIFPTRLVQHLG